MQLTQQLKYYGIHFYLWAYFFVLFFSHKNIDMVRVPFFLFIIWQIIRKKLEPKFLLDPAAICIFSFIVIITVSNLINDIPLDEIVCILNWLFPFYLGKYAIRLNDQIKIEHILTYLLICATIFSLIGIFGYLMNLQTIFGTELFRGGRYRFTISSPNRAGFYLGITLVLALYFFVKERFDFNLKSLFPIICWLIVFASLFFIIKERKSIIVVGIIMLFVLVVYKKYLIILVVTSLLGLSLSLVTLPERYSLKKLQTGTTVHGRLNIWEGAVGLFWQKPIFGHGFPSFKKAHKAYYEQNKESYRFKVFIDVSMAHNLSLNALAETGVLGFLALNGIFFSAWRFYRYAHVEPFLFILGTAICFIYSTMHFGNFVHSATRTDMAFFVLGFFMGLEQYTRKNRIMHLDLLRE